MSKDPLAYSKAIAAVITPVVAVVITSAGLSLPAGEVAALTSALTALVVLLVPNRT